MITFNEALRLLAIVAAYGIAGRLDYDDAVMLDEATRAVTPPPAAFQAEADTCEHPHGERYESSAP